MLNIEQYRKIIPAQKLLGSVRVALLPDRLKNLFGGHMHTREMPTESLEEAVALLPDGQQNLFSEHMHTREMPTESMEEALLRVCFLFASQVCRITGLLLSP